MDYSIFKAAKVLGVSVKQAKHIVFQLNIKPYRYNYNLYYTKHIIDNAIYKRLYTIIQKPKKPYFEFAEVTIKSKIN